MAADSGSAGMADASVRQTGDVDQAPGLGELLKRLIALEEQNDWLASELEAQKARCASLERAQSPHTAAEDVTDNLRRERALTRSQFLRLGGVVAAGAVTAGATGLVSSRPAHALTGDPILLGVANTTTTPETTRVYNPSDVELTHYLFDFINSSNVLLDRPSARVALIGMTSGVDRSVLPRVGVWGQTDQVTKGFGVVGRAGTTGADPLASSDVATGVVGTAEDGGTGVVGAAHGPNGIGVRGESTTGVSLVAAGGGRIRQARRPAGAPTAGAFSAGEQVRDVNGELWLCVVGGTPGTWRRAATVKEGFTGGSVNFLPVPLRLFDSRTGAPLASRASVDVQVTGTGARGTVPEGAVGVIGNVTVTATSAPSGYLALYPQGSTAPSTSNINWFAANQNLSTAAIVGLNPANGRMTIHNGALGGSSPTHVVFDAAGFVF